MDVRDSLLLIYREKLFYRLTVTRQPVNYTLPVETAELKHAT